jgi:hypothetical protein
LANSPEKQDGGPEPPRKSAENSADMLWRPMSSPVGRSRPKGYENKFSHAVSAGINRLLKAADVTIPSQ